MAFIDILNTYGTPHPETILVIQILPLPIPQRIPSAPALMSYSAPYPVAIEPATTSIWNYSLSIFTTSMHNYECPFAISTTNTSTPALIKALARSI